MARACIGFGEFEDKCTNDIDSDNPNWCTRCDELRKESITKSMEDMLASFS